MEGCTIMSDRVGGYAQAIVTLATGEGALDVVEDELLEVARSVDASDELRETLTDIHVPVQRRMGLVDSEALQGANPATRSSVAMVVAAGRAGDLGAIAHEVARLAAESRQRELAEVTVAVALDEAQRDSLRVALEQATGKSLDVKVFVDASLVGGVRAKIGDIVIDGSIARRLDDVRTRIAR